MITMVLLLILAVVFGGFIFYLFMSSAYSHREEHVEQQANIEDGDIIIEESWEDQQKADTDK